MKNELQLKLKLHHPWRIELWLSQDKNNDKLQFVFLKKMRVFGLDCFVVLLLSATHFPKSGHAWLIRRCFSFSQCFRADVFSSLSRPLPAPFDSPISSPLREVLTWRFREQIACPKKTPALQAVPKGTMGYDQYTVSDDCSCRTYFCCFPLALANTFPWPFVPILSAWSLGVLGSVNPGLYRELWRHRGILAHSFPDFTRTTGQERTPRD